MLQEWSSEYDINRRNLINIEWLNVPSLFANIAHIQLEHVILVISCFIIAFYNVVFCVNVFLFMLRYLLEQSLSVDNLFVFVLIFKYFRVPFNYQVYHHNPIKTASPVT